MPHQCVKCGALYSDGSAELLNGCSQCSGKFFFYIKQENIEKAQEITSSLTEKEKEQMEKDVLEIVGHQLKEDQPLVLDLEAIRVTAPGKYEIDLIDLFKGKPLVYRLDEGKYVIDIVSTFKSKTKELLDKTKKVR
ncbi:MAG: Zn-ribbon domain-containing protein [Nanoarchaeota archaeon]|nr:Zn-ribbon domain-containing protein [Nanoarchaeota archaeon]MBU4242241.1 Zn-ribbon domain-containing protein [Nanoarchaeota archaeon]MBU4351821.1 Zn-ribbon domain-containing protein [Nanoarchaeota archaeon]MBU4456450.1 Zn-ribbon domain-containing protein [Nanoarchaeota archaeon]MCG2720374.1 Zn-ribbon domain-containing protein [Nanoarchaeota archaeon]